MRPFLEVGLKLYLKLFRWTCTLIEKPYLIGKFDGGNLAVLFESRRTESQLPEESMRIAKIETIQVSKMFSVVKITEAVESGSFVDANLCYLDAIVIGLGIFNEMKIAL